MSLQYIIDGYNVINHSTFARLCDKKIRDQRAALINLIRAHKLTGSLKNKVTIVFDGYPHPLDAPGLRENDEKIGVIFSRGESADERIKSIVETCPNPKTAIVVSDDKQIRLVVKYLGAAALGVDEFISCEKKRKTNKEDELKTELNYTQMQRINEELSRLWLK
jgi:predicted RNA-binding protein with PIN domain